MKTLFFRRQLIWVGVVLALALGGVWPVQAARYGRNLPYRTAVFQTANTTRIAVGTNHSASLLNVRVGDEVSISYDQENGTLMAHHISDGVPPKPRNLSVNSAAHHLKTESTFAHLHGVVQAVDVQSGTVTLAYRVR
jgi:Cu/Ag efflux protein CusF